MTSSTLFANKVLRSKCKVTQKSEYGRIKVANPFLYIVSN